MVVAKCRRVALAELVGGGQLHIYVENGALCEHPVILGSGVIVDGPVGRLHVTVGTVNYLRRWVFWDAKSKAYRIKPDRIDIARMIGVGRDVIYI